MKNPQLIPVQPVLNWRSSLNLAAGATRSLDHDYHLSAGYLFCENSVTSGNFTPLVPDTDRHSVSIGFGRETEKWSWDVAYEITRGLARTVSGSAVSPAGQSADGRYDWWNHALSVSVGRKF